MGHHPLDGGAERAVLEKAFAHSIQEYFNKLIGLFEEKGEALFGNSPADHKSVFESIIASPIKIQVAKIGKVISCEITANTDLDTPEEKVSFRAKELCHKILENAGLEVYFCSTLMGLRPWQAVLYQDPVLIVENFYSAACLLRSEWPKIAAASIRLHEEIEILLNNEALKIYPQKNLFAKPAKE